MLCLGSLIRHQPAKKPVVDLEKIITDCAWDLVDYPVICCRDREMCKRKDFSLHVDWNYLQREDKVSKFSIHPDLSDADPFQNVCLFETTFQNNSKHPQQFTFKTSRQTMSTYEISVQEGFSIGGNFNLSFSIPAGDVAGPAGENMKLGSATLGGHMTWTGTVGEKMTKSETLTWGIDSQVTVGGDEKVLAQLAVKEAHFVADMELETTITVTSHSGVIPIDVRSKATKQLVDVVHLAPRDICEEEDKLIFNDTKGEVHKFHYNTTALCKAVYGVEQIISITPLAATRGTIFLQELPCGFDDTLKVSAPLASLDSVATTSN